jgi:hypothetical protein
MTTKKPKIILVLGMHRSGTSLVSQLVAKWGAYMGDELMPANEFNEDGYWEFIPLVNLNDKMLAYTGNNWYSPPYTVDVPLLMNVFGDKARALVEKMDQSKTTWCWKDPRMILLLPFWREILSDREITFIVSFRNPLSVAASIKCRNNIPNALALSLWEFKMSILLNELNEPDNKYFINFDQLLQQPESNCLNLYNFLNQSIGVNGEQSSLNEMVASIKPALIHAKEHNEDFPMPYQKELYERLKSKNPLAGYHFENERIKHLYELLQLSKYSNVFIVQLFISYAGKSFNETDSTQVIFHEGVTEISFSVVSYQDIRALRFDPLNEWVSLKFVKMELYANDTIIGTLTHFESNALSTVDGNLFFATNDPQMIFDLNEFQKTPIDKVIVYLNYKLIGVECKAFFAENLSLFPQITSHLSESQEELFKKAELSEQENVYKQSINKKQEKNINDIEIQNINLQTSISFLEQEAKTKNNQLDENRIQIADYVQQITQLTHLLDKLENSNLYITKQNDILIRQIESSEISLKEKEERIVELNYMHHTNEITKNKTQKQIDKLLSDSKNQIETIEKLELTIIEKNNEIINQKKQLSLANNQIDILDHELTAIRKSRIYQISQLILHLLNPKLAASKIKMVSSQKIFERKIKKSELFNCDYYLKNNPDVAASKTKPAKHYLLFGGFEGRNPSENFNSTCYFVYNPDVAKAGMNPLLHYILYGKKERRRIESARIDLSPSKKEMIIEAEKKIIEESGLFDKDFYYLENSDVSASGMDALDHFVRCGWKEQRKPNRSFDMVLYSINDNSRDKIINPLTHHIIFSEIIKSQTLSGKSFEKNENVFKDKKNKDLIVPRVDLFENNVHPDYLFLKDSSICWDDFFSFNKITSTQSDPIHFYITNWKNQNLIIPNTFDTNLYLTLYPDIVSSGVNPLVHFIRWGKNENRLGFFDINDHIVKGKIEYNPDKPTYLIACHESSATGAPLVGLNLCRELKSRYNIISAILREDNINDSFLENSVLQISDFVQAPVILIKEILTQIYKDYHFEVVICNSIGTSTILEAASQLKFPTLLLLHEFSLYTKPRGTIAHCILSSDRIVTPAKIIMDSALDEFSEIYKSDVQPGNIIIAPQGKLPFIPECYGENLSPEELLKAFKIKTGSAKIIIGAGYSQIRKGVDLFISVAEKIKRGYKGEIRFIWVGDGYHPDDDFNYSLWLKIQIESSIIKDDFIFLNHQKNLENILTITDCFLLTSRLDPFPNVVIDALYADKYVACFEGTTGIADFIQKYQANADVVPHLDVHEMAECVLKYFSLTPSQKRLLKGLNKTIIENHLGFNDYVEQIETEVNEAKKTIDNRTKIEKTINDSKLFDNNYYRYYSDTEDALDFYIKSSLKGIHLSNPLPGFSERFWLHQTKGVPYRVPLYEVILNGDIPKTHKCIILDGDQAKPILKIAVHIHIYYIDVAEEFLKYLSNIPSKFDLFITYCNKDHLKKIEAIFCMENIDRLEIIEVENIGRDIAPLFINLKDSIFSGGYDVIGHFHSKKSSEVSIDMGERWRRYLLDNLMGHPIRLNQLLNQFNNPTIGLIFAEDSYSVDMASNQKYADELCEKMNIPKVEDSFVFPLGTMFWARPDALKPIFNCNFEKFLQKEPIPYDGSYLHAVERLLPHLAKSCGFECLTVYTKGTGW